MLSGVPSRSTGIGVEPVVSIPIPMMLSVLNFLSVLFALATADLTVAIAPLR